jgi:hypothetical protein
LTGFWVMAGVDGGVCGRFAGEVRGNGRGFGEVGGVEERTGWFYEIFETSIFC